MKKRLIYLLAAALLLLFCSCAHRETPCQIAATTLPVYEFATHICAGTGLTVRRVVTEPVSCLHDYTLQAGQMRLISQAEVLILSGGGLEDFLHDALHSAETLVDASEGILLSHESHDHETHGHGHHDHEEDPHIWLSPDNAAVMAQNICDGLSGRYPQYADTFRQNLTGLLQALSDLKDYGTGQLSGLSCRELVTFHDGFCSLAESFGLTILQAIEEEPGAEASAATLIELIGLVQSHKLPAIFVETNGSTASAGIIARETGTALYTLDMALSGESYFDAMYRNIDTLREALS